MSKPRKRRLAARLRQDEPATTMTLVAPRGADRRLRLTAMQARALRMLLAEIAADQASRRFRAACSATTRSISMRRASGR